MLFLVKNRILVENRERTFLTATVAAAGVTLSVKAVDNIAWADNDWIIVGEIGTANAEVLQINGAVSDGTSLTVDNAGSGGARYAHSIDEPVYRIDYNQIRFARGTTTVASSSSTLATNQLQPDDTYTRYEDTANTTGFGFVRFFNSQTNALSDYSDAIPYAGQSAKALSKMIGKVRSLVNEKDEEYILDEEIKDALNDKQRDVVNEQMWTFAEREYSASSVANQFAYDKPTRLKTLHTVRYDTEPLVKLSQAQWELAYWDTNTVSDNPTHVAIFDEDAKIYPTPQSAADTTTLGAAITTTTATTITVVSSASFKKGDYFRFIIDSEVIYATGSTATTFTGCLRGMEGTTAATHLIAATVTERNIVFTGQLDPEDLADQNDETVVPEPLLLCYGVAADFCHGVLNKSTLGDRYDLKFKDGLANLKQRFTLKLSSQYTPIKDARELVGKSNIMRTLNNYPRSVG